MISCKSVRRGQPRGAKLRIHVAVQPAAMPITPRVREACHQFGITPRADSTVIVEDLAIPLQPGQILLVTGPSGCGKSRTLSCIADQLGKRAIWVSRRRPDPKSAIIDQVAPDRPLAEAISILTSCGLGEPRLWLRRHADLSDGEQFRLKLAMSVAEAQQKRPWWQTTPVLIVDEFCAILHRRLAKALSYNLRKLITSSGLCLVAATTHDDLQNDLQPDVHLIPRGSQVFYHAPQPRPFSIDLHITPGRVSDYQHFEAMHYRQREGLGPVDKIFVLRDANSNAAEPLGVVVYGYPPLSLHLRNVFTGNVYHRNGRLLNRDFRILRRLVIHPDLRGCGQARRLVAETLPLVNTCYVECLAAMGAVNPIFERAGMIRLGQVSQQPIQQLGIDPLANDFEHHVASRPAVRQVVARTVHTWLRATTGRPVERIRRMTSRQLAAAYLQLMGTRPVYYLWSSNPQEMARLKTTTPGNEQNPR